MNHAPGALPDLGHSQASFFLHHPDLSSEMIAPSDVPAARFQGLKCEVNYRLNFAQSKTETPKQPAVEPLNSGQRAPDAPALHGYGLRSNPKRSIKVTAAQEEINGVILSSMSSAAESEGDDRLALDVTVADMTSLLDFAFQKLIGIKLSSPRKGIRTLKSTSSPSLTDIAPAVWSLQYLQARVSGWFPLGFC